MMKIIEKVNQPKRVVDVVKDIVGIVHNCASQYLVLKLCIVLADIKINLEHVIRFFSIRGKKPS